jgi:hypothetical protein
MIQDKTQSAENGCSLFKDGDAVLNHLASSLWASREAVVRGVASKRLLFGAPLGQDAPLPARRALRPTASRLAEHVNITLKEY